MSFKKLLQSCGKALLYFAIYFGWQIIVMNWVSIAASFYLSAQYALNDAAAVMTSEEYLALYSELEAKLYDILMKYSLHITLVAGALTLLTYFIVFKARKKNPFTEVGFTKLPISRAVMLVVLGLSLNMFVSVVVSIIPFPESWVNSYIESTSVFVESGAIVTLLTTVVCAPLVEEVTFRGLMYTRLAKGMPELAAMIVTSWVFGMVHGTMIQFIYAALLGFVICFVRVKYESLTAGILVHFGFNLFSQLIGLVGELSDSTYIIMMGVGAIIAAACFGFVCKTGTHKIGLTMEAASNE